MLTSFSTTTFIVPSTICSYWSSWTYISIWPPISNVFFKICRFDHIILVSNLCFNLCFYFNFCFDFGSTPCIIPRTMAFWTTIVSPCLTIFNTTFIIIVHITITSNSMLTSFSTTTFIVPSTICSYWSSWTYISIWPPISNVFFKICRFDQIIIVSNLCFNLCFYFNFGFNFRSTSCIIPRTMAFWTTIVSPCSTIFNTTFVIVVHITITSNRMLTSFFTTTFIVPSTIWSYWSSWAYISIWPPISNVFFTICVICRFYQIFIIFYLHFCFNFSFTTISVIIPRTIAFWTTFFNPCFTCFNTTFTIVVHVTMTSWNSLTFLFTKRCSIPSTIWTYWVSGTYISNIT